MERGDGTARGKVDIMYGKRKKQKGRHEEEVERMTRRSTKEEDVERMARGGRRLARE